MVNKKLNDNFLEISGAVIIMHVSHNPCVKALPTPRVSGSGRLHESYAVNCGCKNSNFARMNLIPLPFLYKYLKQQTCHHCIDGKTNDLL